MRCVRFNLLPTDGATTLQPRNSNRPVSDEKDEEKGTSAEPG